MQIELLGKKSTTSQRCGQDTWYIQPGKGPAREMQILGRQVGSELTEKIALCVLVSRKQTSHIRWTGEHGLSWYSLQITFYDCIIFITNLVVTEIASVFSRVSDICVLHR